MLNMTAPKPTIAIDIDDVLSTNAASFIEYSNREFGTHLSVDDYQEHWTEMWKVDQQESERRAREYHESGHIATYGTVEGARAALEELKKRYRLIVLTTRRSSIIQLTKEWIEEHYPGIFDEFIFTGFYDLPGAENATRTKGELAKAAGADYFIDDQPKHVISAARLGIPSLLFGEYAWNKTARVPDDVTRVKDWGEVLAYFARLTSSGW